MIRYLFSPGNTSNAADFRKFLRENLITSCREEYKEGCDVWRGIETKAQGNIGLAGIFIAAVFAFLHRLGADAWIVDRVLLGLAVLFLLGSVLASVLALRVRDAPQPPMGTSGSNFSIEQIFWDHLEIAVDRELLQRSGLFLRDYTKAWNSVNERLKDLNRHKARYLRSAHRLMALAIVLVATLVLLQLFLGTEALIRLS